MISLQITIKGRVQNVGFRSWVQRVAKELSLCGFVKNNSDGTVSIEVEGAEDLVRLFEANCHHGPDWARVDTVNVCSQPVCGYTNFMIRR